jgi:hypothetical protein
MDRPAGETEMDFIVAEVTEIVAGALEMAPRTALICVEPALRPRTSPDPMPTVAIVVLVELHEALLVTSCLLPSLKVPVATNCTVPFLAIEAVPALKAMDCSMAAVPVSVATGLAMLPSVAVICVLPAAWPTAVPVPEPIVATDVFEEAQVTCPASCHR